MPHAASHDDVMPSWGTVLEREDIRPARSGFSGDLVTLNHWVIRVRCSTRKRMPGIALRQYEQEVDRIHSCTVDRPVGKPVFCKRKPTSYFRQTR